MSDIVILSTIVIFFVVLGAIVPFIHAAFDEQQVNVNVDSIELRSGQGLLFSEEEVTVLGIVTSIFTMFFWTFGTIPAIIDFILFVPLRILFAVLLFKMIRGVGG